MKNHNTAHKLVLVCICKHTHTEYKSEAKYKWGFLTGKQTLNNNIILSRLNDESFILTTNALS